MTLDEKGKKLHTQDAIQKQFQNVECDSKTDRERRRRRIRTLATFLLWLVFWIVFCWPTFRFGEPRNPQRYPCVRTKGAQWSLFPTKPLYIFPITRTGGRKRGRERGGRDKEMYTQERANREELMRLRRGGPPQSASADTMHSLHPNALYGPTFLLLPFFLDI